MTIWLTADTHFSHERISEYCERPFKDVHFMNCELVARWNSKVAPSDHVYHLGDFTLAKCKIAYQFLSQLNGHIFLVPGGHDYWLADHNVMPMSIEQAEFLKPGKLTVLPPLYNLQFGKQTAVLCHYAMRTWWKSCHGSVHLHGHSHGTLPRFRNALDCGVDVHDFYPISLEDASKKIEENNKALD